MMIQFLKFHIKQSDIYENIKIIFHKYPFLFIFCSQIFIYLMPLPLLLALLILLTIALFFLKIINIAAAAIYIAILSIFFYQITGQNIKHVKWHYGNIIGNVKTFSSTGNKLHSFILKSDKARYWVRSSYSPYYSDTVRVTGRFVPLKPECSLNPTFSDFLRSKKISASINADSVVIIKHGALDFIDVLRNKISLEFGKWIINPEVASSLVLGMPASKSAYERFQRAGVSHLLAVSGIHLGFFLIFFGFILKLLLHNIPPVYQNFDTKRIIAIVLLFASLFFIYFTGLRVSAVRAFFMIAAYLLSIIIRRPFSGFNALFIAAALIGIAMPFDFLSAGFTLSFAGTAFAMILYKNITIKNRILHAFLFYLLISVLMLPLQLHFFGMMTPISPISNLVIVPLVEFAIIPALQLFSILLVAAPHSSLVVPAASFINVMFGVLSFLITAFGHLIYVSIFQTGWFMIGLFYLALFMLVSRKPNYVMFSLTIILLIFSIIIKLSPGIYIIANRRGYSILATEGKTAWLLGNTKIYKIKGLLKSEGINNLFIRDLRLQGKLGPFYIKRQGGNAILTYNKINIKINNHAIFLQNKRIPSPRMTFIRFFPYPHTSICK